MSEEDKELAKKCVKLRFSASATAALLDSTSTTCSTYQPTRYPTCPAFLVSLANPTDQQLIQNTGVGTTFPNATHSLCYFHTVIFGFNHNVTLPKPVPTPEQAQAIETVHCFVKSWFFDLESEEEYNYSRAALRKYLMFGNGKVLPQHTVDSIMRENLIPTQSDPYSGPIQRNREI
ncbi:hypothetical protein IV203_031294 [Nitzschia inconspicua]|uniref:Uncharacterized protein n=1 Tax=Nitzschia inconspicua TaxID=303405 RepID=A0A9K3LXS9_9STRA|nr:hypothetical protein IV203_031294 [Nitzschia inconspicua]